ncbi:MAG: MarC family protein [Pseudomonadota bacterium]
MTELLLDSFILLFVVIDPIGLAPIYAGITHGDSAAQRRRMAVRGVLIAAAILISFGLLGDALLRSLGVGLPAFQIAGGLLLFLLAVEMVFARQSGIRTATPREQDEAVHRRDVSVFPLAIPLIAGPGALTTVLLRVGESGDDLVAIGLVLAVIAAVLMLALLSLLMATRILKLMGETGANVVSRVLGVVLAALAVQYVLNGLQAQAVF